MLLNEILFSKVAIFHTLQIGEQEITFTDVQKKADNPQNLIVCSFSENLAVGWATNGSNL